MFLADVQVSIKIHRGGSIRGHVYESLHELSVRSFILDYPDRMNNFINFNSIRLLRFGVPMDRIDPEFRGRGNF